MRAVEDKAAAALQRTTDPRSGRAKVSVGRVGQRGQRGARAMKESLPTATLTMQQGTGRHQDSYVAVPMTTNDR